MSKISAFIITKNESARIARAINSVKAIVEELIVIDSGSTDDTVQIARNLGAKVIFNEWSGYVKQKTFGESLCQNDWILNIDADEELSKDLQDEIEFIFASNIQANYLAYRAKIVILHRNDHKVRRFAPYNECIRLYNRKYSNLSNNSSITTYDLVLQLLHIPNYHNLVILLNPHFSSHKSMRVIVNIFNCGITSYNDLYYGGSVRFDFFF